jgi:glycerol-3-phosphate dehydrogenase
MRPLVGDPGGSTVKASREHRVSGDPSGLVRISGGKYTTYRVMARDVVDAAIGRGMAASRPSETADLPLIGAAPRAALGQLAVRLALEPDLDGATARAHVDRHGTEATAILTLGRELDLVRRLGPAVDQLEAEVVWAARRELAASLDDVLARRMRLAQVLPDRGESIAARVAELLGGELGWDPARQAAEVARYIETARREYGVPWPAGA